jgi:hypothetical protein
MEPVAVFIVDDASLNVVADVECLEDGLALSWSVFEPCTNRVEDSLGFKLTSESAIVDDY